ncbi:MAG: DUF2267 domain-containing protein [Anaerolineae bacterium]|nr:DUF2267 domain-containing protein [Anaerolineae bacterium]
MQYDEFVGEVQNRARLPSRGDTVRAIQATLGTLAERIAQGEADDLAAQLPPELSVFLEDADTTERFSVDDFFLRMAAKESADVPDAAHHARAVMAVLREAVTAGELDDIRGQLPDNYDPLFEAGSEGEMDINV